MATIQKFEDLDSWKLAKELCKDVYKIIKTTELEKNWKLRDQIDGSSGSVIDNIAEGFERGANKEFIYFLSIAKAACGETKSQLYRCYDREFINEDELNILKEKCTTIGGKIGAFMNYLNKSELKVRSSNNFERLTLNTKRNTI